MSEPHEEVLLAIYEIQRDQELGFDGVCASHLREHPRTKHMTDWARVDAVKYAEGEGWLARRPRYFGVDDYLGIHLSEAGRARAKALAQPWWRRQLEAISRDAPKAAVSSVVSLATISGVTFVVLRVAGIID